MMTANVAEHLGTGTLERGSALMQIGAILFHWTWVEVSQLAGILVIVAALVTASAVIIKKL